MIDISRRDALKMMGTGLGSLGLAAVVTDQARADHPAPAPRSPADPLAPKPPHFRPRAKRIIHLFMNGGVSQVDTFDHKPALTKFAGQRPKAVNLDTERKTFNLFPSPFAFKPRGKSGLEISDLFPKLSEC